MKLENGDNIKSRYEKKLALYYGDHIELIKAISDSIQRLNDRINDYGELLEYATMVNDKTISDHIRQYEYLQAKNTKK